MRPLEGYRVLDLTHVLAGPFCSYQLAVLGADVIKIESPLQPDMTRQEGVDQTLSDQYYGTDFQAQNGGKRAMTLDLRQHEGQQILKRLIRTADVLVQNFSGDKLARLGFGPEEAQAINPKLIYCAMTGFGRTGPKATDPAYDNVIQAFSGLMSSNVEDDEGAAIRIGPPIVDYGTGAQAALAITGALLKRERTGEAQVIDVSMLDCAMMLMSAYVTGSIAAGESPPVHGNDHPKYSGYRLYDTADEPLVIGAYTNGQMARLLDLLGEDEWAVRVRTMPRKAMPSHRETINALIASHFRQQTAAHWEAALNATHVPAARVRQLHEALGEAQVAARAGLQKVPDRLNETSPGALPVAGFICSDGSPRLDRRPPLWGEHTEDILTELGYEASAIENLRATQVI